jgi:hypothetical protein
MDLFLLRQRNKTKNPLPDSGPDTSGRCRFHDRALVVLLRVRVSDVRQTLQPMVASTVTYRSKACELDVAGRIRVEHQAGHKPALG